MRYATRLLGNRWDAEESVQDAFVRAFRSLARFDPSRAFEGWLFGILVNCCRTRGASRSRTEQRLVSMDGTFGAASGTPQTVPAPADDGAALQQALMQLPRLHREALLLKYQDDWTYDEIAAATGTRVSALKMRVKRAKAHLEALLSRSDNRA